MKLVWDLECDGLNPTKIWIISAIDMATQKVWSFSDFDDDLPDLMEFTKLFAKATVLSGHNIIGFDLPVLERLTGWKPTHHKVIDTLILSQLNDYYRPQNDRFKRGKGNHALDTWGQALGHTKPDDPDWDNYSKEMRNRCEEDIGLNLKLHKHLMKEVNAIKGMSQDYASAIKLEHEIATEIAKQEVNGWLFDGEKAKLDLRKIKKRMAEIELEIEPQLKDRVVALDKEPREPKIIGDGRYDRITRDWFNVEYPGEKDIPESYIRTKTQDTDLGSNEAVIELLLEQGWEPTEWNWKVERVNGRKTFEKRGPKLTEDSFDSIKGGLGKMVAEWRMLRSRNGFIENQLKLQRPDGKVACSAFVIGTNTFRMRHRGIVNVPGAYAPLGKEIRSMYIAEEGRRVVAADSSGNQLRGFCHYLDNQEVSDAVAEGVQDDGTDVHSRTARLAGVPRNIAKNLTYALLFGAGDKKLAKTGGFKESEGKEVRAKMMVAYEGYDKLLNRVENQWKMNEHNVGRGFVWGLDGRPVFCEKYKALNALLQAFEAVTMKEAAVQAMKMIDEEGLDAKLVAHYHDEVNLDVADKDAKRVSEILEYSLGQHITEKYQLNIPMAGDPKIGDSWFDVH